MAAAGICHTDDHFATGDTVPSPEMEELMRASGVPTPEWFPCSVVTKVQVVEEVGPNVTSVRPGDRIGMSFIPACGRCRWCVGGQSYICDVGAHLFAKEMTTDGTVRRHLGDEDLMAMTQLGTFAEYVVTPENSVIKHDSIPFHAGVTGVVRCHDGLGIGNGGHWFARHRESRCWRSPVGRSSTTPWPSCARSVKQPRRAPRPPRPSRRRAIGCSMSSPPGVTPAALRCGTFARPRVRKPPRQRSPTQRIGRCC
jgi:hypothetical protein